MADGQLHLRGQGKLLEAQRIEQRTQFDLEMIDAAGVCPGIGVRDIISLTPASVTGEWLLVSLHGALQSSDFNVLRQVEQIATKHGQEAINKFARQSFDDIAASAERQFLSARAKVEAKAHKDRLGFLLKW